MQKWQQTQKQKVHESIVENAKSSFKRYSNSREKPTQASRVRIPNPVPKNQMPINKILQIFQLQHYGMLLSAYKFTQSLTNLETISDQNDFIHQISQQVELKDRQKFESLLHTLVVMSKNMKGSQKVSKLKQPSKNSMYYAPPPSSTNSQPNYTPSSLPKTNKSQSRFRIKIRNNNITHNTPKIQNKTLGRSISRTRNNKSNSKQIQELSDKTKRRRKSINILSKGRANDDLVFVHNFNLDQKQKQKQGKIQQVKKCSKIIKKLTQKLQKIECSNKKNRNQDIQLQMNKIKQMYLSFDSATLSSNINNIDLQQLTQCFASQIIKIMANCEIQQLTATNEQKIRSLLKQSFIIVKQQSRDSKTQLDSMRQSPEIIKQQQVCQFIDENIENYEKYDENFNNQVSESCESQFTDNNQRVAIKLKDTANNGLESSIWGNNYIASVINDFSCFDNFFNGDLYEKIPTEADVKNLVDLIMMAGKMQKQIPILAYVYIIRLLKEVKGSKLSKKNWRNIIVISLIQASKIWDDRSLQNHSFAKIIHPYTTLELNRLQKYLLFFLDYHLNINQKQYSESYFQLRKHSGTPCHTVNLVKLDLKTIKKLQNMDAGENIQKIEKKQFMRKIMNKSF